MKWFSLEIGDQTWTVHLVPQADLNRGHKVPRFGECRYADCTILISDNLLRDARSSTLLHELTHAALYVSGASMAYAVDDEVEERIVTALTPTLHAMLRRLGLRFPRVKR